MNALVLFSLMSHKSFNEMRNIQTRKTKSESLCQMRQDGQNSRGQTLLLFHNPVNVKSGQLSKISKSLLSATFVTLFACLCGFRYARSHQWKSLPNGLRSLDSYSSFKSHLKSHFFHNCFPFWAKRLRMR